MNFITFQGYRDIAESQFESGARLLWVQKETLVAQNRTPLVVRSPADLNVDGRPPLTLGFLIPFLATLLAVYFLTRAVATLFRKTRAWASVVAVPLLIAGSLILIGRASSGRFLLLSTATTLATAVLLEHRRRSQSWRAVGPALLAAGILVNVAVFGLARAEMSGRAFMFSGVPVATCLAVALLIDVYRHDAGVRNVVAPLLYLVQFLVLPAGPIVRYRDFIRSHLRLEEGLSLGAFTYGTRRLIIGLVKILVIAAILRTPVDRIFEMPTERVGARVAWLAAACFALQLYYLFSGYADVAVGVGRMFGFRYPDNFRRPYAANSIREFWRRWNITAITWLRDYLSLPVAGRDAPTPRLFLNTIIAFCVVGLWHGAGSSVIVWAVYSASWLALEALGLGRRMERWPAIARHLYVLVVVVVGCVFLRADTITHGLALLGAMVTGGSPGAVPLSTLMTTQLSIVLLVAIVGAGPLIPWISRWRVGLDAATAAVVMVVTAMFLFAWRGITLIGEGFGPLWRRLRSL